jgi:hypothetical protein
MANFSAIVQNFSQQMETDALNNLKFNFENLVICYIMVSKEIKHFEAKAIYLDMPKDEEFSSVFIENNIEFPLNFNHMEANFFGN